MFKVYNKLKEVFILSIFNKLKALSTKQGISQKDLATQFNMSYNSFNNKIRDCETRFNIKDLIIYKNTLNHKVAILDNENNIIDVLSINDLKENND